MSQRVIFLKATHSYLMNGDPELGTKYTADMANMLPVLIADGWRIHSVYPAGDSAAYMVLSRDQPPKSSP